MRFKVLIIAGLFVCVIAACKSSPKEALADRFAIYGQPGTTCHLQATTERPLLGKQMSADTFPTRAAARVEGCRLVSTGDCGDLKEGMNAVACPTPMPTR
jgi:hypothetical protein